MKIVLTIGTLELAYLNNQGVYCEVQMILVNKRHASVVYNKTRIRDWEDHLPRCSG